MSGPLTTRDLYNALRDKLGLRWIAGRGGSERTLQGDFPGAGSQGLTGPLNFIHPNRVQIVGRAELIYFAGLNEQLYRDVTSKLFTAKPAAVILTDEIDIEDEFVRQAEHFDVPLFSSTLPDNRLVNELQYYLTQVLADRTSVHGVFVDVLGIGTLLTGAPAVGKSELAFELISRGHHLVADDMPEFARITPDIVTGTCPPLLKNFLEVRGLGVLNIREMFGDSAIRQTKRLRLIIDLQPMGGNELKQLDRLKGSHDSRNILGLDIPEVTIPVAPGRNLAILVEAAVRQHMLRRQGYDAAIDFSRRQEALIAEKGGRS
ncbi:MAG: HPr(Ser) kinase/phosphatase [Candidatus Sedimenticola endophacoides]